MIVYTNANATHAHIHVMRETVSWRIGKHQTTSKTHSVNFQTDSNGQFLKWDRQQFHTTRWKVVLPHPEDGPSDQSLVPLRSDAFWAGRHRRRYGDASPPFVTGLYKYGVAKTVFLPSDGRWPSGPKVSIWMTF